MDLAFEAVCKVGIEADKKSFGYQCNVGKPQTIGPFQGHQKIKKRINNLFRVVFKIHISIFAYLKELYTLISTLAQKLVLTLLNNEFILKIQILTFLAKKP